MLPFALHNSYALKVSTSQSRAVYDFHESNEQCAPLAEVGLRLAGEAAVGTANIS
jgi:hypothetical protein